MGACSGSCCSSDGGQVGCPALVPRHPEAGKGEEPPEDENEEEALSPRTVTPISRGAAGAEAQSVGDTVVQPPLRTADGATESLPQEEEVNTAAKNGSDPLANELTGCPSTSSQVAESPLEASPSTVEAEGEPNLSSSLQDILAHLHRLEADRAWAIVQDLKARCQKGVGAVLASLESLPECHLPLRWFEAWGPVADEVVETLTSGAIPPPPEPRPGEPPQQCEWSVFPMTPAEDDGIQGTIYVRYLQGLHGVEIRSELIMPGKFSDHYEGLMEVDYGAQSCPACYDNGRQWRATIPGNFLVALVIKPPLLPKLWWRDIVMHRQVVNFGKGVYAIEYSPTRSTNYMKGGEWELGMPDIKLPKCTVSGRESQFGGYYVEPASLPDGSPGVRWRNVQVAEIHLPKWAPVAKSWYVWAAAFILRRTLREFGRARASGAFEKGFKQRAAEWPSWYKEEWYMKA